MQAAIIVELSYSELIGRALDILRSELTPFVERQLHAAYKQDPKEAAAKILRLPSEFRQNRLEFDVQALLAIIWSSWNDVFQPILKKPERSLVSELRDVRNRHAHQQPFSYRDTLRALDTAERMLRAIQSPAAATVEQMHDELLKRAKSSGGEPTINTLPLQSPNSAGSLSMTRSLAMVRVNAFYGANKYGANKVRGENSTFSNINRAVPLWWLDIPVRKLEPEAASLHNILLYDNRKDKLYHLAVPTVYLRANKKNFIPINNGTHVRLHLSTDESKLFRNVVPASPGVEFKRFLQATA